MHLVVSLLLIESYYFLNLTPMGLGVGHLVMKSQ